MIAAIHQPNFIPWLGYFYKIAHADTFVFLDNVQFTKNSFINRNRIKTSEGEKWVTMPVIQSGHFGQHISACMIQSKAQAVRKLLAVIRHAYHKAPFFTAYFDAFSTLLQNENASLADVNISLIEWVCTCLEIDTPMIRASSLSLSEEDSSKRLIEICRTVNADVYLSGKGGTKYQDDNAFRDAAIALSISPFSTPEYPQQYEDFNPNLTVLDALFMCGKETKKLIL